MLTIGQFNINKVSDGYAIIHKNEIIHTVDTLDSARKITQVFNKIYNSGRDDGGDRLSKLRTRALI